MERITFLSEPPVVGRKYLVPTVFYGWLHQAKPRTWPVLLPFHSDADFLAFPDPHYHVDARFLSPSDWQRANSYSSYYDAPTTCQGVPLARRGETHPPIVWRARTCHRSVIRYSGIATSRITRRLLPHYGNAQARRVRTGWVCPHRGYPLGSAPVVDGVITCPLHGLCIDAETGRVIPEEADA